MPKPTDTVLLSLDKVNLEQLTIRATGLDPIRVTVEEYSANQGAMTVTCYGRAWTASWGSMGTDSVRKFVLSCDVPYLVGCLVRGMTPTAKRFQASDEAYLAKIVDAIQKAFPHPSEVAHV